LHGLASAIYARKYLNINVKLILDAIANHVIPSKHPTTLDMILYCADKLEPARTIADVKDRIGYIKLAKRNLKQAFTKLYRETLKHYL
jgi:nicotinate-nucleotide adenylyltransferase